MSDEKNILTEEQQLIQKWDSVINAENLPPIKDNYRKITTAIILENCKNEYQQARQNQAPSVMNEAAAANNWGSSSYGTGGIGSFDPIMISLVRRSLPNNIGFEIAGLQPMTGPTGLAFALKSRYVNQSGNEALFQEADTAFTGNYSAVGTGNGAPSGILTTGDLGFPGVFPFIAITTVATSGDTGGATITVASTTNFPSAGFLQLTTGEVVQYTGTTSTTFTGVTRNVNSARINATAAPSGSTVVQNLTGKGMPTANAEALGTSGSVDFNQMAFTIDKVQVSAVTRALKAEYTMELAQDLKAVHGLDAERELFAILANETLAEQNREIIRSIYTIAKLGAQQGTATPGVFDLDIDANGRWSVEKFKGLYMQVERDANAIAKDTRMGKGNFVVVSADVASALSLAGILSDTPRLNDNLTVDDTGNLLVGTIYNGKYKVFVDPYFAGTSNIDLLMVGYKGVSPWDAGFFYCPYVPAQMYHAVDPTSFQPKLAIKTRYATTPNPFFAQPYQISNGVFNGAGVLVPRSNGYYRLVQIKNLM